MRLKYKLFLTLLAASALLVLTMFLVSSWSFSRGFLGYINDGYEDRMQPAVVALQERYAQSNNWDWATNDPEELRSLLATTINERPGRGLPGPRRDKKRDQGQDNPLKKREPRKGPRGKPPPRFDQRFRWVLADANKQPLAGQIRDSKSIVWEPIEHGNDIVGYFGFNRIQSLENQFDQQFEKQQKNSFAIAGISMVLLSALLSVLLASRINKPVMAVKKTVAELRNGNLGNRIAITEKDEIGDLAQDINKLGETLQENQGTRQRLFSEISHELRTPVAVLRGELELLQDGLRPFDQQSVASLHSETLRLGRLIDDLNTLSMAQTSGLEYQMDYVNLKTLLDDHLEKYRDSTNGIDITLHTEDDLWLQGDKQRLTQLIDNLMQNSIRYTDTPGNISVELTNTENTMQLIWQDSAPGVSNDSLERLFEPLYRDEQSRNRALGGSGLGLSIVQKIAQAHGGTVQADLSSMGGLKIIVQLPKIEQGQ